VPGAQIEIYPGPALASTNLRTLNEKGIQAVLREVEATGLFIADAEYLGAQNFVADAQDTVFSLHAGGRDVTIRVYALGILSPGDNHPGVSAAELAAHVALNHLMERLMSLDSWLPASAWVDVGWTAYRPDAMRLLVRNADADQPGGSGIDNQLLPWPAAEDPAAFGAPTSAAIPDARCGVVAGADAILWYDTLSSANELTRFTYDGHNYAVSPRLFLPDEALECPPSSY